MSVHINTREKVWTAERIAQLKQWWAAGYSAGQISSRFGKSALTGAPLISRSAVCGKVHRLGLPKRTMGAAVRAKKPKQPAAPRVAAARREKCRTALGQHKDDPVRVVREPIKPDKLLGVLQLTETTCRWPIGEPGEEGFGFCGTECGLGQPYCETHRARAVRKRTTLRAGPYSPEEKAFVRRHWRDGAGRDHCAKTLNRSKQGMLSVARKLGLSFSQFEGVA